MTRIERLFLILLLAGLATVRGQNCTAVHTAGPADSLAALADYYFGDTRYASAILLATNTRSADPGFSFIANPASLPSGAHLCIPELPEAVRLRLSYQTYLRAVADMVRPEASEESKSLVVVDVHQPVRVVSWIRAGQLSGFGGEGHWVAQAPADLWVTVVPYLQTFCREFARGHNADAGQVALRLEQRLGLPPGSSKTIFLEMIVPDPKAGLFRPCAVPAVDTGTCPAGPPPDTVDETYRKWFYQQYYSSYAVAHPSPFPWTALGYTFDWDTAHNGRDFLRYGESEFVVRSGAAIEIQSATDLGPYCQVQ